MMEANPSNIAQLDKSENVWKSLKISNKSSSEVNSIIKRKPKWIRVKLPTGKKYTELRGLVDKYKLNKFVHQEVVQIWVNAGEKELQLL